MPPRRSTLQRVHWYAFYNIEQPSYITDDLGDRGIFPPKSPKPTRTSHAGLKKHWAELGPPTRLSYRFTSPVCAEGGGGGERRGGTTRGTKRVELKKMYIILKRVKLCLCNEETVSPVGERLNKVS